jgi:ABC-type glycerol-3-phosphate transport system substrate-binding protein
MREAVADYVTLMRDFGPSGAASIQWTDIPSYILEGDAAMVFDTSGWGGVFHGERDDLTETLITGPADNHTQWLYAEGLGIPSWIGDGGRGAAWQLIQWRMSEEVLRHEVESQNRFDIPHEDVIGADWYNELAEERGMGDHVEVLQESFEVLNDEYWPYVPEFSEIGNAFMQEMSDAVDGQQSPDEAVENAQQRIEDAL